MEEVLAVRLRKSLGLSVAFIAILSVAVGCQTNGDGASKFTEVSEEICDKLREYQGIAAMGIDLVTAQIDHQAALKAQLIAHDTLDVLELLCQARDLVVKRHELEAKAEAARAADESAAFDKAVKDAVAAAAADSAAAAP